MDSPKVILVCDDQPDVLVALELLLKDAGYRAKLTSTPSELLDALHTVRADVALTDMNFARDTTSGGEGLALVDMI